MLTALEEELRSVTDDGTDPHEAWVYVQAATRLSAEFAFADDLEADLQPERLLERASEAAAIVGDAETGPLVELFRGGHLARHGRLRDAERAVGEALERFPESVGYAAELRLMRARLLRRLSRWSGALDELDDLERHVTRHEASKPDWAALWAGYRAGVWGERAQTWVELGTFDRALACLEEEARWAARSGRESDRLNSEQHHAEFELVMHDFGAVAERTARVLSDESPISAERRGLFELIRAGALLEHARLRPELLPEASEAVAAALAAAALPETELLRAWLLAADLELERDDHDAARAALERAAAIAASWPRGDGRQVLEAERLIDLFGSRLARESGAPEEELRRWTGRVEAALDVLLSDWAEAPNPPDGIGFLHLADRRDVLCEITRLALATSDEERAVATALDALVRAQALGGRFRESALPRPTVDELRAGLSPGQGLLVFLPGRSGSHLFALDGERARHFPLVPGDELRRAGGALAAGLRSLVRAQGDTEGRIFEARLGREGALLLPEPVRRVAERWSRVTIVGADLLRDPPIECLPWRDGLLGEELAVSYLPSLPLLPHLSQLPRPSGASDGTDLFVLATLEVSEQVSREYSGLASREFTAGEVGRLTRGAGGWRVGSLLGAECTSAAVSGLELAGVPVIHLLAHGVWDAERGSSVALAGAGLGGLFGCEDIRRLELGGFVLLSACQAARGRERWGEDRLLHLGGAVLEAGARCVMLSRTDLELELALDVADAVLAELASGASPAEALRRARAHLARGASRSDRLRAGAYFTLGAGHQPVVTR